MKVLHLLDYGTGNVGSLLPLFASLGYAAVQTADPDAVAASPLVVLPGVGSARTAVHQLHRRNLLEPLRARHAAGRPIVGICLGAQLMFEFLEESQTPGLGLLPGRVARLPDRVRFNTGWRRLGWTHAKAAGLTTGLKEPDTFFFNHQYALPVLDGVAGATVVGEPGIPAMYGHERLCAVQFHPEKSQAPGRLLMRNILRHYHGL